MISIDLTRAQKIQIGVVVSIMTIAAYLVYKAMQPPPDLTIASWVERVPSAKNPLQPLSAANPVDPSKTTIVTIFALYDGRLSITEYPPKSELKADFDFTPDSRRKTMTLFKDLLLTIQNMSDPYKRALSYSAYRVVSGMPGLLSPAKMTADQRAAEKDARDAMMSAVTLMENGAQTGLFKPEIYDRVMAALKGYKAAPGDPTKDAAKAVLAHKVVELALQYIALMQDEKAAAIKKYVASVEGILTADQRATVQKAGDKLVLRARPVRKVKVAGF